MKRAWIILVMLTAVVSCTRIPPRRMLPLEISRIYIPMVENKTYEPGLEEKLTRQIQEEFLMDGRLDVVRPQFADAVLKGTIKDFEIRPEYFGFDDVALTSSMFILVDIELFDPNDRHREKPLMTWRDVDIEYTYTSDVRLIAEVSPGDAYEEAMEFMARQIVRTVISEPPEEYEAMREAAKQAEPAPPRPILGSEEVNTQLLEKEKKTEEERLKDINDDGNSSER